MNMNGAHFHLLINHLPIVGTYFALLVLVAGYIFKNTTVKNTGLALIVVAALVAIPAYLTGDPAEDVLKAAGQANKSLIHEHEENAEGAIWVCEIGGLLALIALYASNRKMKSAGRLTLLVTLAAVASAAFWVKVGVSGGEIRHTEIRSGNAPVQQNADSEEEKD
jgi:uncharacterized membrane protein